MFNPADFFQFLSKPQYKDTGRAQTNVLFTAIKIYLLILLLIGLINSLNITILRAFLILPIDETLTVPVQYKEHLWIYFILVGIFAPVLEEVIFRLSLIFDPVYISLSISTLFALIIHKVSNSFLSIITFILLFILVKRLANIYSFKLFSFWTKNFPYIFYFLSVLFGVVHISNYKYTEVNQYLIVPILIFPQLAIGFILSFTRLYYKKGFLICIIIHVLMNLISMSVFLLESSPPSSS
jgi:membrane protease YdiL (CAAX protease family)